MSEYTHGHDDAVLRSHRWRTAENSAGYLLGELKPGMRLLDIGCGPGTITADLAERVAPGRVVGIDREASVLASAAQVARSVEFLEADCYELPFADGSFDVVHAHQVLQHLTDPVAALKEMARVVAPGGVIAVRDGDYGAMTWYPELPQLSEWNDLYHRVTHANEAQADAGRRLKSWALAAGFTDLTCTASVWCYSTDEDRQWWGGLWADRTLTKGYRRQAFAVGATEAELHRIADGWRVWAQAPDGWFAVPHGEVLARVG